MKTLARKRVRIAALALPPDIEDRMETQRVKDLARSIEHLGVIADPVVREIDRKLHLIAGADRIAACLLQGMDAVVCKVIECDDLEAFLVEDEENLRRRNMSAKERAEADERIEKRLAELIRKRQRENNLEALARVAGGKLVPPPKKGRGPGKKPETIAREYIAAERGVKPNSIVRLRGYHKNKEKERLAKAARGYDQIDALGMAVPLHELAQIELVRTHINKARSNVGKASRQLQNLIASGAPIQIGEIEKLLETTKACSSLLIALCPRAICPACKRIEDLMPKCAHCDGAGYAGKRKLSSCPSELLDSVDPKVFVDGEIVRVDDYLGLDDEEDGEAW